MTASPTDKPKYKGTCEGGPLHGQWAEADFPLMSHTDGGYEYVSVSSKPNTWLWRAVAIHRVKTHVPFYNDEEISGSNLVTPLPRS